MSRTKQIAKFTNKHDTISSYTISFFFRASSSNTKHVLFQLSNLGELNLVNAEGRIQELTIYPNHVVKTNQKAVYDNDIWSSCVIFLDALDINKRHMYTNNLKVLTKYFPTEFNLSSIYWEPDQQKNLNFDSYSGVNNFGIWTENLSDKPFYQLTRLNQQFNNRIDPLYLNQNPFEKILRFYVVLERTLRLHPLDSTNDKKIHYSYWNYNKMEYPVDYGKGYFTATQVYSSFDVYYCNHRQQFYDGLECRNTSVIGYVAQTSNLVTQKQQGLVIEVNPALKAKQDYTLEFWFISAYSQIATHGIDSFYKWRKQETDGGKMTNLRLRLPNNLDFMVDSTQVQLCQDDRLNRVHWTHILLQYKLSQKLDTYIDTEFKGQSTISQINNWNNMEGSMLLGDSPSRNFAIQHLKIWDQDTITYRRIEEAHNDRGYYQMLTYYPLMKRQTGDDKIIYDVITKRSRYVRDLHFIDPSLIAERTVEGLAMCRGDFKYAPKAGVCRKDYLASYEFYGSSTPYVLTVDTASQGVEDYTIEFYFKQIYEEPSQDLPYWIIKTNWTLQGFEGIKTENTTDPKMNVKINGTSTFKTITHSHRNRWVHFSLVRRSNTPDVFIYYNLVRTQHTNLYTLLQKLPKQIQLSFSVLDTGTSEIVRIGIKEFRIWSEPHAIHQLSHIAQRSVPMTYPGLDVYVKFDNDEIRDMGNTLIGKAPISYDLINNPQTIISDLYPNKINDQHCPYHVYQSIGSADCTGTQNTWFTNVNTSAPVEMDITGPMSNFWNDGERGVALMFYCRYVTAPNVGETKTFIEYDQIFKIVVDWNSRFTTYLYKADGGILQSTTTSLIASYSRMIVRFNSEESKVEFISFSDNTKNFNFPNIKMTDLKSPTTHKIKFGDIYIINRFRFSNLYIFYPMLKGNVLQEFISFPKPSLNAGDFNLQYAIYYDYPVMSGTFASEPAFASEDTNIIIPISKDRQSQSETRCPVGTVRGVHSTSCVPQQAFFLGGNAQRNLNYQSFQVTKEYTILIWFKPVKIKNAQNIVQLSQINSIDFDQNSGLDNFRIDNCACGGACSGASAGFDKEMEDGDSWMQLAVVQYIDHSTFPYVGKIDMYKDGLDDTTKGPYVATCQDYSAITPGNLRIGPSSTAVPIQYQITKLMIFTDALSQGELLHLTYSEIQQGDYFKSLKVYYKLDSKRDTQRDYTTESTTTSLAQPGGSLTVTFRQQVDGPVMPVNRYAVYKDKFFNQDQHLFFPKTGHDLNRVIMPATGKQMENGFTMTFCAWLKKDFVGFKGHFLGVSSLVNFHHTQGSTGSKLGITSQPYLIGDKFEDDTNEVKFSKWFCGAIGGKSTTAPLFIKSELYAMNDQAGRIKMKKTVVQPGEQYIKTDFNGMADKFFVGGHSNGPEYQCQCMLAEVKFFNKYMHGQKAFLYFSRHHVSALDEPNMLLYAKLNEGGGSAAHNLADGKTHMFDAGATFSQPYWMKAPERLQICEHDQRFSKADYDSRGYCSPILKALRVKQAFNFKINSLAKEGTLGFYYLQRSRVTSINVRLENKLNYVQTTSNQVQFQFNPSNFVFYTHPTTLTGFGNDQWHYIAIRFSQEAEMMEAYNKDPTKGTWDVISKLNMMMPFPTVAPGHQDVKILDGIQAGDEVYLQGVTFYVACLLPDTIKFRYNYHLKSEEMPALMAYFFLTEGSRSHPLNQAAYAIDFYDTLTAPGEWTPWVVADPNGLPSWFYCFRDGYVKTDTNKCRRERFDCSSCTDPDGLKQCKGPSTVPANCLQKPVGSAFDPDMKEYLSCHKLCPTCTTPTYNKGCLSCLSPYVVNSTNSCEMKCNEGFAFNTSAAPPVCLPCGKSQCNCLANKWPDCIGCMSAFPNAKYILNGPPDGKTPYCASDCGAGKYFDQRTSFCKSCYLTCGNCIGYGGKRCTSCFDPNNFKLLLDDHPTAGECKQVVCGETQYRQILQCNPCSTVCYGCDAGTDFNCTSCPGDQSILHQYSQYNRTCIDCSKDFQPDLHRPSNSKTCLQKCTGAARNLGVLSYVENPVGFCSDGNLIDGDGCDRNCMIEDGYKCEGGNTTSPDVCVDDQPPVVSYDGQKKSATSIAMFIKFSEKMDVTPKQLTTADLEVKVIGPKAPYKSKWTAKLEQALLDSDNTFKLLFTPQSTMIRSEKLSIKFLVKTDFKDMRSLPLQNDLLIAPLNKFEYMSPEQKATAEASGNAALYASLITVGINLFTNLMVGGAMSKLWDFINTIQIIYYMPLINIYYPLMLKTVLSYFEFAMADITLPFPLPNPLLDLIISQSVHSDGPLNETYDDFGITSMLLIQLYTFKLLVWTILLLMYPVVKVLLKITQKLPVNKITKFILKKLIVVELSYRYNGILRILTELYLELSLFSFINLYNLQYNTFFQVTASCVAIGFMLICTILPVVFSHIVSKNHNVVHSDSFDEKFGVITENMKHKLGNMFLLHFLSIFLYRRLIYVFILTLLIQFPWLQMLFCVLKNSLYLLTMIYMRPFASRSSVFLNILNESFIWVTFVLCCGFIRGDLDDTKSSIIAYIVIVGIGVFSAANMTFIMIEVIIENIKGIRRLIKRCRNGGSLPKEELIPSSNKYNLDYKKFKSKLTNKQEAKKDGFNMNDSRSIVPTQQPMNISQMSMHTDTSMVKPKISTKISQPKFNLKQALGSTKTPFDPNLPNILPQRNPANDQLNIKQNFNRSQADLLSSQQLFNSNSKEIIKQKRKKKSKHLRNRSKKSQSSIEQPTNDYQTNIEFMWQNKLQMRDSLPSLQMSSVQQSIEPSVMNQSSLDANEFDSEYDFFNVDRNHDFDQFETALQKIRKN